MESEQRANASRVMAALSHGRAVSPFNWLLGDWRITRTIPGHASIAGRAQVVLLAAGEALYKERVEVALESGKRLTGTRRYHYHRTKSGVDILFAETDQLFQSLQFRLDGNNMIAEASHDCASDRYDSTYILRADDCLTVVHTVHGPTKNYISTTEFVRTCETPTLDN
jgi:Family of unknown function (DUF6314)